MEKSLDLIQDIELKINPDSVLFFDMDGTLVDTNLANFLSYRKAIDFVTKSQRNLDYDPYHRFNRSMLKNVVPNLTEHEYEKIIEEKEKCYIEFFSEVTINKVIAEILFKYAETNKTVLVTNCRKDRAMTTLNHFKLIEKFNNIFYRQSIEDERKINKFQNALTVLGISPKLVIAFENEETEVVDARLAGIQIIHSISFDNDVTIYHTT